MLNLAHASALDPNDPYPRIQRSWVLWILDRRTAAKALLRRVLNRHPTNHWAAAYLAQQHLVTGQPAAGQRAIAHALAIAPNCSYSLRIHADLLANRGRYHDALAIFDRLIASDDPIVHAERGLTLGHVGDYVRGITALDRAIEIAPKNRHFWRDRAALLLLHHDIPRALRDYNAILKISPLREHHVRARIARISAPIRLARVGVMEPPTTPLLA